MSLARNALRRLDGVEAAAGTLTQLWVSYNALERLAGADGLPRLRVLFAMHNRIGSWAEVERLGGLRDLDEVAFAGNPIETAAAGGGGGASAGAAAAPGPLGGAGNVLPPPVGAAAPPGAAATANTTTTPPSSYPYRIEILRRLPRLVKIDGAAVTGAERAAALAAGVVGPAATAAAAAAAAASAASNAASATPVTQAHAPESPAVAVA